MQLGVTYNISVYAAKVGCETSETATATLCWIDATTQTEGITNGVAQIAARPVLVKTDNGFITVEGADEGTQISAYTVDAVLDRIVHTAHQIELTGESVRKINAAKAGK